MTSLVLVLLLAKPSSAPPPPEPPPLDSKSRMACEDERETCRSGCSLDFGSLPSTQKQLVDCLLRCDERSDMCLMRMVARQREQAEQAAAAKRDSGTGEADGGEAAMPATPYTMPSPHAEAPDAGTPSPPPRKKRKTVPGRTGSSAAKSDKLTPGPLAPQKDSPKEKAGAPPKTP